MPGTDASDIQAAQAVKVIGSAADGTEETPVGSSSNRDLFTNDSVRNGAIDGLLPLTSTPSEGKVGASRKVNRKYIWMMGITVPNSPNGYIYWGFSNTTQNFKLFKDQLLCFPIGEDTQIWFKTPTGSGSVSFGEGS